jgi:hypothetical protein
VTTATYVLTLTFTVEGEHTPEDLALLAAQAGVQIEDPRDDEGDYTTFQTANLHVTMTRSIL